MLKEILEKYSKDTHGIYLGRFQPLTIAHSNIIKRVSKENKSGTIFLVKGKKTSQDKENNPFDEDIQIEMIKKVLPANMEVKVIPTGFFINELNQMKYDNFVVYAGTDRIESYKKMVKYSDGKNIIIKEIKRTNSDISGTKVRQSLKDNDLDTFKKMTPKEEWGMFDKLRKTILEVK